MTQCIKVGNVKQKSMTDIKLAAFFSPLQYTDIFFYTHTTGLIFQRVVRRQLDQHWISS